MGLYTNHIFPRLLDWTLGTDEVRRLRARALSEARGAVLEIGFGTGLNLAFYPKSVNRIVALDSEEFLKNRVAKRINESGLLVERVKLDASGTLPFADQSFDTIVTTFTLCSIPDELSALREMRRVLRPSGKYLFLEHGRSDDAKLARRQDRWNPVQKLIGLGCNLNRRIDAVVESSGFRIARLDRLQMAGAPAVAAPLYLGAAVHTF
ncbi:MAG TPA: class I SAM-dependent methyltransferase [Blastocatellia bacterium]|nr:class I SAM-dependent methyltransferase [Blastocatellia bacterium]